jgi:protein ImuB
MLNVMIARFAASGLRAHAALADSWSAAYAFARYAAKPLVVVPPGESATAILDLPIAALRLPKDMVESLRVLGFNSIGELPHRPRAPLTLRFGPELGRCLDQVTGSISEPIDSIRPPDLIEVRQIFGEPIGAAETIVRYIGKLVVQLCELLEAKGLGAKRLDLLFHRGDNRIEAVRIGMALPVRDVRRLTRLLCDKIETVDPGFGIEIMRLAAPLAEHLPPRQMISSLTEEPEAREYRPYRHADQSRRRQTALPFRARCQRRAGTFGHACCADRAGHWCGITGSLASAFALIGNPGADRDACAAARSSACVLHLARYPPPR